MLIKTFKNNKCFEFLIDDEDYAIIKEWDVFSPVENGNGGIYLRLTKNFDFYKIQTYFHRYILNCPTNMFVDHINGNTLDNTKNNLRIVSSVENRWNTKKLKNKSSIYIGVIWCKYKKRWKAKCNNVYLGLFDNEKLAAFAYDTYCRNYRGEYSKLNFPDEIVNVDIVKRKQKNAKNS